MTESAFTSAAGWLGIDAFAYVGDFVQFPIHLKKSLDFSSEIKAFLLVHPAGVEPVAFRVGV